MAVVCRARDQVVGRVVAVMQRALVASVLLAAGCQTPRARGPATAELDADVVLDGGAEQGALDAAAALADAEVDAPAHAADSASPGQAAPYPSLPWRRQLVDLESDGRTGLLSFEVGALGEPVFALRTYAAEPATKAPLCFQLEEVSADQTSWVPRATSVDYGDYCTECTQRVAAGHGYGLFMLPSGTGLSASVQHALALRIALRDCATLTPLSPGTPRPRSLVVESVVYTAPPREQRIALPVLIGEATPYTFVDGARLEDVFTRMRELWRPAGIELVMRGPLALTRPAAPVKYDADNRAQLSAMTRELEALARERGFEPTAPRVVLTPCLVRDDVLTGEPQQLVATTTHVPGGFGVQDEPDNIFVAGERCGGLSIGARYLDSETLASVMAHELGHFLGLFHVQEADGRQDALPDTDPSASNMMQARPSPEATHLTESQIAIARRHLALAVPP